MFAPLPLPAIAERVTEVGGFGVTVAVIDDDAALAADVPLAFVATAVKVYAVPSVKPVTVKGDDAPDAVSPPGLDVTVYPVIADPPVAPAVNATVTCKLPFVKESIVGAAGTVVAVTPADADEADDVPYGLVAVAV